MRKFVSERVSILSVAAPFVALLLTKLWFDFAISGRTEYSADDYYVVVPLWWEHLGLSYARWIEVGVMPAAICGVFGLVVIIGGMIRRSAVEVISSAWSVLLAPAIGFHYMVATF